MLNKDIDMSRVEIWVPDKSKSVLQDHVLYKDHFLEETHIFHGCGAISVGEVPNPSLFSRSLNGEKEIQISDLCIKRAGSNEYHLPDQLRQFKSAVKIMAEDQHARNPLTSLFKHAVLYIQRSRVKKNRSQRGNQWHRDCTSDFQRAFADAAPCIPAQIYIAADRLTTEVQNRAVKDSFNAFDHDWPGYSRTYGDATRILSPGEIVLINEYAWHRGNTADKAGVRTFLSLLYLPTEDLRTRMG